MYHSRSISTSWLLANSGSTWAIGTQWNARSHAAYHGYSHGSGIEITSALFRCRHPALRPCCRVSGGGGPRRIAVEPALDVVVEELLAPHQSRDRLPQHQRLVGLSPAAGSVRAKNASASARRRSEMLVERVGPDRTGSTSPWSAGAGSPASPPAGTVSRVAQRRLRADPIRVHRRRTDTTWSLMPSFGIGGAARHAVQPLAVRLVVAEQRLRIAAACQRRASSDAGARRRARRPPCARIRGSASAARAVPRPTCCGTTAWAARRRRRLVRAAVLTVMRISRSCGAAFA